MALEAIAPVTGMLLMVLPVVALGSPALLMTPAFTMLFRATKFKLRAWKSLLNPGRPAAGKYVVIVPPPKLNMLVA